MPFPDLNSEESKRAMWKLAQDLFPLPRTLISQGFNQSLELLQKALPMNVRQYPTGLQAWDWVVPEEWNVREAYVAAPDGKRLIDYKNSNLHLSAYSTSVHERVSKDVLFQHLKYLKDQPEAIPYNFLYYKKGWEFNIAYAQLPRFTAEQYDVHIDVDSHPSQLKIAECFLPGRSKEEIVFSTYLCHPSMANDNLSGVLVCLELFKYLSKQTDRKYSYRLLVIPETIGSLVYMSQNPEIVKNWIGGFNVYICGDPGPITYKKSYAGNSLMDRAARLSLKQNHKLHSIRDFAPLGSDERQYNAPGVRLPVGGFTRTPPGEYKEYHTSKDDLSVITPEALFDSLEALSQIIDTLEMNDVYINQYRGEPFFSKYNMKFESYHLIKNDSTRNYFRLFTNEIDGRHSLLDIAEKWDIPMPALLSLAEEFSKHGLIKKVQTETP